MECLGYNTSSRRVLLDVGGFSYEDAEFLLMTIWKDRRSLISLVERRILLGLPALLFTLYGMMAIVDIPVTAKKWMEMQDVTNRAYLTSVDEEHDIMRGLVTFGEHQMLRNGLKGDSTTDDEDARNVIRAYNNMIARLSTQGPSPIVTLDSSNIAFQYITSFLYETTSDCIPGVVKNGLERLWLEIDLEKDNPMEENRLPYIWDYVGDVSRSIA
ncbi:hypothetical protein RhiJN_27541 [Ceratobasidium sp. AG-Ba]|nr:hypothetical protein RhiJN_13479 [Ceratobasidium sp. AG-Ba]QRV99522.1 hypothetical protein RhiJN_27541 [Ceratobasidium sp. AG-Ba]QRW14030.1 hypothetical protein RhiLY_13029 [Ceratobasidium sp. AG-Ba]